MFDRQDVCGLFERFDLNFGLLLFNKICCVWQECVRFSTADDERGDFQFGQVAPQVKITQASQVDVRLPFGRIDQLIAAIRFLFRDALDVNFQIFIADISKDIAAAITTKDAFEIIKNSSTSFRASDQWMYFFSDPGCPGNAPGEQT